MFWVSLNINYNWSLTYFWNQLLITSTQMNINKSHEITVKHFQMKVQVYNYYSDYHICTIAERDLALHNTTFSSVSCMRLEWCSTAVTYCVTMSPHVWNKHVSTQCVCNILQKLTTIYQYQSHEITPIWVQKRIYDMQLVTIKICCCNDIDFIQKVAFIPKDIN